MKKNKKAFSNLFSKLLQNSSRTFRKTLNYANAQQIHFVNTMLTPPLLIVIILPKIKLIT